MAAPGIVRTQAQTMRRVTPQRTAERRRVAPTPTIAPVMVCVVLTGMPKWAVASSVSAPADSAAKPPKASYLASRAFYPLTMPLTVGPGSISVAIAVGANRAPGSELHWTLPVAALLGCAALAVTIYLMYRFAELVLPRLKLAGVTPCASR